MTGKIPSLLLVDDEPAHLEAIRRAFLVSDREINIRTAGSLGEYREKLTVSAPDIAILDLNLPDGRAVEILTAPSESGPFPIVIMTGYGDEQRAVEAMKAGALDYIVKSPEAFADMPRVVRRALREWKLFQENRRAVEALRASEEKHRIILQTAMDGFWLVDTQGRLLEVNETYCRMSGYSEGELLAMNIFDLDAVETVGDTTAHIQKIIEQGEDRFESRHFRKDGSIFDVEISAQYRSFEDGRIVAFLQDVTEHKRLEQQLLQAQKMETIGRLAGGVAHDFNNILTVINANAELALMFMEPADPHHEIFEEIKKSGERAANLTRQLLAFSRKQIIEPKVINLNQILLDMDKMLRRLIGENIDLFIFPEESLLPVKADPGQLEQVLINLAVNARDAMPEGGKLTIETRNESLDEEQMKDHPDMVPGEYVMFAVSDTGIGMDQEVLSHVFEPFYTTKPTGSGVGLGLSTCYGIVKQNNGDIQIYSEPGRGATVKVYLPAIVEDGLFRESSGKHSILRGGTETLLLVEDDPGIRALLNRYLSSSGYRVLAMSNGNEALSEVQEHTEPIHLLVTDVVMPLMGGKELAERLTVRFPGLRILYMSGYTDDSFVHRGVLESGIRFIQKPFSMVDFMRKIRETLEG